MTHDELVKKGVAWLRKQNCGVILHDPFAAALTSGERPDVMGFRSGGMASIVIECKTTRADFLADRKKTFRINPERGLGRWRFMMAPVGLISVDELPERWGLLEVDGRRILDAHGVPGNMLWASEPQFEIDEENEIRILYSALSKQLKSDSANGVTR